MRALVTGASGFVGRHLVSHLRAEGDEVLVCDRTPGDDRHDLRSYEVDITNAEQTASVVADARPEVIYHLAGWADVGGSWKAPVQAFRANAEGTLNVLSAASEVGVDRVLSVSSADVYGAVTDAELPLTEDAPLRPTSPYAASKVAADFLGLQAWLGRQLPVLRVRAFNHLGPGQTDKFVAAALASRIARNERDGGEVLTIGNLSARRDFTDVRDVVRAYRLLVGAGEPGQVYNVCSGHDVAVQDLADQLLAMAKRPMRFEADPQLLRPVDVPVLRGSHDRLTAATGWAPEIPLADTLHDLLDDWRARVAG